MSKDIEQALRALRLCDQKIEEANLLLEHLEGWYGTQCKPSESMGYGHEYCEFYHHCKKRLETIDSEP